MAKRERKVVNYINNLNKMGVGDDTVLDVIMTHLPLVPIAKDSIQKDEYNETFTILSALGSKKRLSDYTEEAIKKAIGYVGLAYMKERGTAIVSFRIKTSKSVPVVTHFHSLNLLLIELNSYLENGFMKVQKRIVARMDKDYSRVMGKRRIMIMGNDFYMNPANYETVKKLLK